MIELDHLRDEVVGRRFPDGRFTIEPHEAWLSADALYSPPLPDGVAHPMYIYYVGLVGMGITLDELFAMVHSSAAEGPMFGELSLEQHRPLRLGETVTIQGEVVDVTRKGGKSGTFDIVTFVLTVVDADGDVAGVCRNSFIFPRRS